MKDSKDSKDILIKNKDIENIKVILQNTKQELTALDKEIEIIEQRKTKDNFRNFINTVRKIIIRIDIKSGANLLKLILWIGMAGTIVYFSTDINAKIIGALTFFLGIIMDMILLRKQLPMVGVTVIRLLAGISIVVFFIIMIMLILGLMAGALDLPISSRLSVFINWALFICGFVSTFLELVNSIAIDD